MQSYKLFSSRRKKYAFFFVTLRSKTAKLLRLGIKKIKIFCSALDFS